MKTATHAAFSVIAAAAFLTAGYLAGAAGRRVDNARHAAALLEWLAAGLDGWSGDDEDGCNP